MTLVGADIALLALRGLRGGTLALDPAYRNYQQQVRWRRPIRASSDRRFKVLKF
jgi:hypothetical protein